MNENQPQDETSNFLGSLTKVSVSKNAAFLKLARKQNERSRVIQKRRKQQERLRNMVKNLKTTDAELEILNKTINEIKVEIDRGSDDEIETRRQ